MVKQIGSRVNDELYKKITENAEENMTTVSEIVKLALLQYFNPEVNTQMVDLEELQKLKTDVETLNQEKTDLLNSLENQKTNIEIHEIEKIVEVEKPGIYIQLDSKQKQVLESVTQRINSLTKQNLSVGETLFRLFNTQLTRGAGDWLPEILSKKQIENIYSNSTNE